MGIYDRDYYRKEGPSYLGAFAMSGQVCRWLVGINVVVFIAQMLCRQPDFRLEDYLMLNPRAVMHGEIWRLLTYAFLHDPNNVLHIVFNMWMLWLWGGHVEGVYGRWQFLSFYLVAAVVGGLAFVLQAALGFNLDMNSHVLGASGAVMAVTVLCAFHFPSLTVLLFFVLPMPIWLMAVLFVIQDAFGLLNGAGAIAFSVHLGGAAFAALYYKMRWRLLSLLPSVRSWKTQRRRPRLRVYHGEDEPRQPVGVTAAPPADLDEQLEAKLDAVLAKVTRSGQASLTESEKQLLLRASEIYKKRRS
jgi:membrane associated rhomboid family serine protease